jgi:hypothetical protein
LNLVTAETDEVSLMSTENDVGDVSDEASVSIQIQSPEDDNEFGFDDPSLYREMEFESPDEVIARTNDMLQTSMEMERQLLSDGELSAIEEETCSDLLEYDAIPPPRIRMTQGSTSSAVEDSSTANNLTSDEESDEEEESPYISTADEETSDEELSRRSEKNQELEQVKEKLDTELENKSNDDKAPNYWRGKALHEKAKHTLAELDLKLKQDQLEK